MGLTAYDIRSYNGLTMSCAVQTVDKDTGWPSFQWVFRMRCTEHMSRRGFSIEYIISKVNKIVIINRVPTLRWHLRAPQEGW